MKLTPRQHDIMLLILLYFSEKGCAPTVREIASFFGIASPNGVTCHLLALERKGCIRRQPYLSRGIELAGMFRATESEASNVR